MSSQRTNTQSPAPDISELLEKSRLRITDVCELPPEIMHVGDSVIATLGNFSGSTGKAKSKKTFNVCAMVAAAMVNGTVLQYRCCLPPDKRNILYVDTEQSSYHCQKVMQRILRLSNLSLEQHPDNLDFLALRRFTPLERIAIIEKAIYDSPNIGLVIIDGIRDLAHDINSPSESTTLITKLMQWTDERQIHIHTILHQNKGDENARGHIGTELSNKAETIFQIAKDKDDKELSVVSAVHIRSIEFQEFAFRINDVGLPELDENYLPKDAERTPFTYSELSEEQHRCNLEQAFAEQSEMGYGALIKALQSSYGYAENKTKNLKVFLSNKRMILKEGKKYRYNPDFHY